MRRTWTRSSLAGRVAASLTAVLAALLVVGAVGGVGLVLATDSLQTVSARWDPARHANARALQALTNAETGLRGYQLTGKEEFLAPYRRGLKQYPAALDRVSQLVEEGAGQRLVLTEEQRARAWVDRAERQVHEVGARGSRTTDALEEGKRRFDRYRAANAAVSRYVREQRDRAVRWAAAVRTGTLVGIAVATLLLVLLGVLLAVRTTRQLTQPLDTLRAALERMTRGDWSTTVPEEGPAEVRAVATSVNQLAAETRRLQSLEQGRQRMDRLSRQVARQVTEHLDLATVLEQSVGAVGTALRSHRCFVRLVEEGELGPIAADWARPGHEPVAATARGIPGALADLLVDVASRHETLLVADTRSDPRFAEPRLAAYVEDIEARSVLARPLVAGGTLVGVLSVLDVRPRHWTEVERDFAVSVAEDVARAISNAKLFSDQQDVVAGLRELDQAKSDFMSTVSHELRTPLTSIVGYLELLADEDSGQLNGRQRHMLSTVERNAHRLRTLVEDLLILSRIQSGGLDTVMGPVDVQDLVDHAVASIGPAAEQAQVDVQATVSPDAGQVTGDADQLERVLLNLLSNAVKFTPADGEVAVSAGRDGDHVAIRVSDTGIGVPLDEQDKLFTRFFRSSNAKEQQVQGTGLGLAIVRSIVERHRGRVALQSTHGEGTTVTVWLPPRRRT